MMWVLGGLSLFMAVLFLSAINADLQPLADQLKNSAPPEMQRELQKFNVIDVLRACLVLFGGTCAFVGISLAGCAFFVRRGSLVAMVYSMIIAGVCALFWLISMLTCLLQASAGSLPAAAQALFSGMICFVFGLCAFWLINAAKLTTTAARRRGTSLGQIQYPPGYTTGYGSQVHTPLPPPPQTPSSNG